MPSEPRASRSAARPLRTARQPRPSRLLWTAAGLAVLTVGALAGAALDDDVARALRAVGADEPAAANPDAVLSDLWRAYTAEYLEPNTHRTVDPQTENITTSEGQSYTMLRAVWMDDLPTFTDSWQWTKDNLQRPDFLLSWRFGERADGSYGIQDDVGGANTASDADVDVAFALLMAYSRWKVDLFLYDALPLIDAIWTAEVVDVGGRPVLVANDLERLSPERVLINPSYFAPYAYRVFAAVDPDPAHDWHALVDGCYTVLEQLRGQLLDADWSAGLPPDWVFLDRRTGGYTAVGDPLTTRFGYDALRLPWRLALDVRWHGEQRALNLLSGMGLLGDEWTDHGRLAAVYLRNGRSAVDYESAAMYGGAMGYFVVADPPLADDVYSAELLPVHDADTGDPAVPLGYYDSNWVWFGMALYLDQLPDLTVTGG